MTTSDVDAVCPRCKCDRREEVRAATGKLWGARCPGCNFQWALETCAVCGEVRLNVAQGERVWRCRRCTKAKKGSAA